MSTPTSGNTDAPSDERGVDAFPDAFPVVGVGASAGGLEAFTQLLKLLPDDSGMAFVLIQHPDLQQPSSLGETLARATRMKVRQADDGVAVEPNHVYVIPPSAEVAMSRGRLSLMPGRLGDRLPSPSIDRFLRSLAADRGSHAIGVVLSGNASDGVEGLRAIKAEHGITFAQTPTTARFAQMPSSAVQAGVVDRALPIPELAQELVRLSAHPYVVKHERSLTNDDAGQILAVVRDVTGIDLAQYQGTTLERRLARRMALRRAEDPRHYLALLQQDQEEVRALFEDIRLHVTSDEKLRSSNDALEAAQEALQTTHDEMTVVADELESRNREVDALTLNINKAQVARAEAEHANDAKDIFLAVLGHELRTPLSSLLLYAQRLQRGDVMDTAKVTHVGEAIERATRLQMKLIDDLLDVSRIVAGKLKVELLPVNLCAAVRMAIEAASGAVEKKSLRLEVALDESIGEVAGDLTRLQQVVSNLLTNAIKFTPDEGQISVTVDAAGGQARLRVSDTGRGIQPDFMPRVFDRFSQQDSSSARTHAGLGLGLAIVRNLVEQHGGTVQAESPGPGMGATFTLTFPLLTAHM